MDLADYRENYNKDKLDDDIITLSPDELFTLWFKEVLSAGIEDPTAMVLATADHDAKPSARMVLLKGLDPRGFIFFTNYNSRKASELEENPSASLLFFWKDFHRQVRVEGNVHRIPSLESDQYFNIRPLESRISSIISPQSSIVPNRQWLEEQVERFKKENAGNDLSRPEFWGGYILIPEKYEFWQGRENRLHDRIQYVLVGDTWEVNRLAP